MAFLFCASGRTPPPARLRRHHIPHRWAAPRRPRRTGRKLIRGVIYI